jgi:hypothetical protein
VAMADAAIVAWAAKYHYNLWRPVVGIREHDEGFGMGHGCGVPGAPGLRGDACWAPLGAPQTNDAGKFHATPNFPAYPSGHATFGATVFTVVKDFYSADLSFNFVSDEFDGKNRDPDGSVRTFHLRKLSLSQAIVENSESRIHLGVHWRFDGFASGAPNRIGGVPVGIKIAQDIALTHFKKVGGAVAAKSGQASASAGKRSLRGT